MMRLIVHRSSFIVSRWSVAVERLVVLFMCYNKRDIDRVKRLRIYSIAPKRWWARMIPKPAAIMLRVASRRFSHVTRHATHNTDERTTHLWSLDKAPTRRIGFDTGASGRTGWLCSPDHS